MQVYVCVCMCGVKDKQKTVSERLAGSRWSKVLVMLANDANIRRRVLCVCT